jgi:hypothetical protein
VGPLIGVSTDDTASSKGNAELSQVLKGPYIGPLVIDDAAPDRLVDTFVDQLLNGVTEPVLQRAFEY